MAYPKQTPGDIRPDPAAGPDPFDCYTPEFRDAARELVRRGLAGPAQDGDGLRLTDRGRIESGVIGFLIRMAVDEQAEDSARRQNALIDRLTAGNDAKTADAIRTLVATGRAYVGIAADGDPYLIANDMPDDDPDDCDECAE